MAALTPTQSKLFNLFSGTVPDDFIWDMDDLLSYYPQVEDKLISDVQTMIQRRANFNNYNISQRNDPNMGTFSYSIDNIYSDKPDTLTRDLGYRGFGYSAEDNRNNAQRIQNQKNAVKRDMNKLALRNRLLKYLNGNNTVDWNNDFEQFYDNEHHIQMNSENELINNAGPFQPGKLKNRGLKKLSSRGGTRKRKSKKRKTKRRNSKR